MPSCPAIPDTEVRYGYSKDKEGQFKIISKTNDQV